MDKQSAPIHSHYLGRTQGAIGEKQQGEKKEQKSFYKLGIEAYSF